MSDDKNYKQVRGIGRVITSADAFDDYDKVSSSRLSVKREDVAEEEEDKTEAEFSLPADPSVVWDSKPSVHAQAIRFPDSLRLGPPITEIFNFSDNQQLKAYNDLYAKIEAHGGPLAELRSETREFYAGTWHACVTYSQITYKKL